MHRQTSTVVQYGVRYEMSERPREWIDRQRMEVSRDRAFGEEANLACLLGWLLGWLDGWMDEGDIFLGFGIAGAGMQHTRLRRTLNRW